MRLSCTLFGGSKPSSPRDTLIVGVNGIDSPQSLFYPTANVLLKSSRASNFPLMLTYDRPGQGTTTDLNADVPGRPKRHARDCLDAAHDLRDLVTQVGCSRLGFQRDNINNLRIVIVGDSVGCAIARLYAQEYPKTVTALLLLDSTLANSDTVSVFPDPNSSGFSEKDLPPGITAELCEDSRRKIGRGFDTKAPNREGLWRGNLPELLPFSDAPKLQGPRPGTPYVTVVEHDNKVFPEACYKVRFDFLILRSAFLALITFQALRLATIMTETYFDPAWHLYNEGLAKITEPPLSKGPIVAKGCGHLIVKDDPQLVADELTELLDKLSLDEASRI